MKSWHLLFFLGFFLKSHWALGNIVLSEVILDFRSGSELRKDISVSNIGKKKMYVAVQPYEIENPGEDPIKRKKLDDPRKSPLVVTPNKFVLEPGQKRILRFLRLDKDPKQERIFRVRVEPKLGKVSLKGKREGSEKITGVKVLVGYDVLVMLRPNKKTKDISIKRTGRKLIMENSGNINYLVREVQQCEDFDSQKNCKNLKGPRVYPGKREVLKLAKDAPAKVFVKSLDENSVQIY